MVILMVLAGLWLVYWYGASQIAAAALDRVVARAAAEGYALQCADPAQGGFPLSLDLGCSKAGLTGSRQPLAASFGPFSARAPLYWPGRVESEFDGPLSLEAADRGLSLTAQWAHAASAVEAGIGGLKGAEGNVSGLSVALPAATNGIPLSALSAETARFSFAPGSEASAYRLSGAADGLALTKDDGQALPPMRIAVEADALDLGSSLGLDPRQALRDWIVRGGALRVRTLDMEAGGFAASASGPLSLSADGKLSGTLTVRMRGLDALPDLVEAVHPGSRERVANIAAGMMAFTKPVETPDGPAQETTLLLRDGVVSLGIFPIGVIPPVRF